MIIDHNLNDFFVQVLEDLPCRVDTKSYIVGIFTKYKTAQDDFSKDSITMLYSEAKMHHNFSKYQNLADWIFFANTIAPQHLNNASKDYYQTIARLSYYSCYRLIDKQWVCFEELADNFISIEHQVKKRLTSLL